MSVNNKRREDNFNWLQKNWRIVAFFITLIFFAGIYATLVLNAQSRLDKLEMKCDELSKIKSDIDWIKNSLKSMGEKLDQISYRRRN